jgi:ribA/ribD-fused uncharacterized protein
MENSLFSHGLSFLEKYYKETDFALTRHHIDSYEKCVFDEIPSIIHSNNPIVFLKEPLDESGTVFAYRVEIFIGGNVPRHQDLALSIAPPIVTLDEGNTARRMFPNEARLRNLTYAAQISADIHIRVTFTRPGAAPGSFETEVKEAPVIQNFPLFRLPILLRSKLCATGVADPARLEEMGECRNDYGGYFIIGGAEKVLITREEQAFNSLYVERRPNPDDPLAVFASVVSLDPATKQTRRVALNLLREGEIRATLPMIRGSVPLFILFRALGLESDEEIARMIFPDPADPLNYRLQPVIEDAYPIHNKYLALKYIMSLTKGYTEAHVLDILENLMLPHVPNEPLARAQYLAEMAREAIRAHAGLRDRKTDRDDMRNQRFLTTGVLVRELFNGCWKDWRAAVILAIDTTYRSNAQLYTGERVFDLFAESNLLTFFQPMELNKKIMRGFRGHWGTNERNIKKGVLQPLARISYLDALSHTRRVVSDFDTGMKSSEPRRLHTSQVGYFCTSETPQGAHIGATKNMSMMTQYSFSAPMGPVYEWMKAKGGLIPVAETTAELRASAIVVQINGGTVGFTLQPNELVRTLRLFKWNGYMSPTASVSFNTIDRTVRVFLDEGRPIRPLWHVYGKPIIERIPELLDTSWRTLVFGSATDRADVTLRSTEFLDPLADKPDASFDEYEALLAVTAGHIEYCDPMEINEAYISWWGGAGDLTAEHTHIEIHPSTMMGVMASMIPYSNHNQAPRNQLSNSQSKQGIGYMATNIKDRFDTYSHMLCYGEAPISRTFYYETIAAGQMPYGFNCIIAATSESGYNQDDGLIINKDSVARGMFQSLSFRTYDCAEEVDPLTKVHSHVANPATVPSWTNLRPGLDYSRLDERGIIRENEIIDDRTVLVGRYMVLPDTGEVKDASVTAGLHTQGRVESVVVLHQGDGLLLVKIRVIEMRSPVLGDKFSSRHGQKGTIGMFVAAVDMPRTADGIVPDVMVNPGGLISRMTVAQLVEMLAGRVGADVVAKLNATTFCNGDDFVTQLGDILQAIGCNRGVDNILYSGITGAQIRTDIFMAPLYFMRLKHLTEDKVNARGAGRREIRTHQPTGGRANEGGMRVGEMERDTLCAHGISEFLHESMMKRGDATDFWICNGCGRIPIYNETEKLFVCPSCDGPLTFTGATAETLTLQLPTKQSRVTFSRIAMPYAMKLLDQEMTCFANTGFRFVAESSVSRVRDSELPWPGEGEDGELKEEEDEELAPAAMAAAAKALKDAGTKYAETEKATQGIGHKASQDVGYVRVVVINPKTDPDNNGFSTLAATPFRIPGAQLPGPDGTAYPAFGGGDPARETWPTVEHYYQAMKFPSDPEWQEAIRQAPTPGKAKRMGLDPGHPVRGDWDAIKEKVMKGALAAKFRQNPALLHQLQRTGVAPIREMTTTDPFWSMGSTRVKGKNRLGALLEELRREVKDVRVDTTVLGAARPSILREEGNLNVEGLAEDGPIEEGGLASIAEDARDLVATATNGLVQMVTGGPAAPEAPAPAPEAPAPAAPAPPPEAPAPAAPAPPATQPQQGGVYLFVNPQMQGAEAARVSRYRGGSRQKALQWEGMSQEGGGSSIAGAELAVELVE